MSEVANSSSNERCYNEAIPSGRCTLPCGHEGFCVSPVEAERDKLRAALQLFIDIEDISTYAEPTKLWAAYAVLTRKARALLAGSPAETSCSTCGGTGTILDAETNQGGPCPACSPEWNAGAEPGDDIADILEKRGDALSVRAARHIRIKSQTEEGLRQQLRRANDQLNGGPRSSEKASG